MKNIAPGIYKRGEAFYVRPGNSTWKKLQASNLRDAREEAVVQRKAPSAGISVKDLVAEYQAAECPKPNLTRRGSGYTEAYLAKAVEFFGSRPASSVRIPDCISYHAWRGKDRASELDLAALSSAFNWAVSAGILPMNGIKSGRPRFVQDVVHCREQAFETSAELHEAASHLFEHPRSMVLGFQMLVEAFTGLRTGEVLALRLDAQRGEPGFVEGNCLWVRRTKRGTNPFVRIHDALARVMKAHRAWLGDRSQWWFPGMDLVKPVSRTALTNALKRLCINRTSHGLRSFYVTARRSQGASDEQVAAEIGDSTVGLISRTYGNVPPTWATGGSAIEWIPAGMTMACEGIDFK